MPLDPYTVSCCPPQPSAPTAIEYWRLRAVPSGALTALYVLAKTMPSPLVDREYLFRPEDAKCYFVLASDGITTSLSGGNVLTRFEYIGPPAGPNFLYWFGRLC